MEIIITQDTIDACADALRLLRRGSTIPTPEAEALAVLTAANDLHCRAGALDLERRLG